MKKITTICFVAILIPFFSFCQKRKKIDSFELFGLKISNSDTLKLGMGSVPNGDFKTIIIKPSVLSMDFTGIGAAWSNKKLIIESIYEVNDGLNKVFYLNLKTNTFVKFTITDMELSIRKKEVELVNGKEFIIK